MTLPSFAMRIASIITLAASLAGLAPGSYVLCLVAGGRTATRPFIVLP